VKRAILVLFGLTASIGLLAMGIVAVQVSTGATTQDPRRLAEEWGHRGGWAWHWAPPLAEGSGMELVVAEFRGKPCILYRGAGHQGGPCFQNGWAVEANFTETVNGTLVSGVAIREAATVRFGNSRDALHVPVVDVPHRPRERYFAFVIPTDGLRGVKPNDIVALDHRGRLLGRQHYNDGRGRFGAYDGLYDRRFS
jgi:hypothetical protein